MTDNTELTLSQMLANWDQIHLVQIALIVLAAWLANFGIRRFVPALVRTLRPHSRFFHLPWVPLLRLFVIVVAAIGITPLLIKPTPQNLLALAGTIALTIGFGFKDFVSSLLAGIVTLIERPYRVGDWVKIGETYGEITQIDLRTVSIRTPDDNQVLIPHATLWTNPLSNATCGQHDLLCETYFYLHPDHDGTTVRKALYDVAITSPYHRADRRVVVVAAQLPFGMCYKIKAHPKDARDQFLFMTDLTIRGLAVLQELGAQPVTAPTAVTL